MADFFDKLKQGLSKGVAAVSVKSREMLDANRVTSQIAECERNKRDALAELGATVCTMLDGGLLDQSVLESARATIARLDDRLSELREELQRIHATAQRTLADGDTVTSSVDVSVEISAPSAVGYAGSTSVPLNGPKTESTDQVIGPHGPSSRNNPVLAGDPQNDASRRMKKDQANVQRKRG